MTATFHPKILISSTRLPRSIIGEEIRNEKVTPRGSPALVNPINRGIEEQEQKKILQEELQTAKPKVDYFEQFINAYDSTNLRNTAKELGIPERDLVQFLLEKKYMYRDQDRKLMPYAEYTKRGYFIMKDYYRGNGKVYQYTLFTAKGKAHFQRLLEKRKRGE